MIRSRAIGVVGACLAVTLAACQGSSGTGALSIPAPQYNPAGPSGSTTSVSRQQTLEGAVTLGADRTEVPLPSLDGFSVSLQLGTPTPATPAATPPSGASGKPAAASHGPAVAATASPSLPVAASSPSPVPSGSSSAAGPKASASPDAESAKIVTKTTVYPDDAPEAPSPKPSGDVVTFAKRTAIVRGYLSPPSDLSLYGLGAIRFTIPQAEQTSGRGFTVAVFTAGKKHHEALVAFDAAPVLVDGVVASSLANDPLVLKKTTGYLIMLYGDELAPAAGAAGAYPTPGTNPFPTQTPGAQPGLNGYPQQPQQPGYPQQPGAPQYSTPTPLP